MTTRWHFDRTVTQREILERNRHHKHLFVIWSTLKTDGFLTRFREHRVPSTWRRKISCSENISVPVSLPLKIKAKRNQNRYFTFKTVINYLILNEIISSTIVYDQDANRSRRFTLAELGASLYFIAICFIQCFLFVDIWTFTWICYRISNKQKVVFQGVTTVTNQHSSSWIYLEGMFLQLDSMSSQVYDGF